MKRKHLLLGLLITLCVINANAQIVYTDITDGVPAGIDFNSDGTNEFDVAQGTNPGDYIDYNSYGQDNNIHAIGTLATQDWDVPNCVDFGFVVDASNQWEGQGDCSLDKWGQGNPTITFDQDEYLAVRFNLGSNDIYYGWIRFSMSSSGVVTYKDYAYNSTPNTPISAGNTGSSAGIDNLDNNINLEVYPNPAVDVITIANNSEINITNIKIIDLLGKEVKEVSVSNFDDQTIDISDLNKGVYLLNIFSNNSRIGYKRIVVK